MKEERHTTTVSGECFGSVRLGPFHYRRFFFQLPGLYVSQYTHGGVGCFRFCTNPKGS